MCVIMAAINTRPTPEMVERAWDSNDDGGGVAWRESVGLLDARGNPIYNEDGTEATKVVVKWKKGIDSVDEMKELCAALPLPFISHFRIASVGGKRMTLTHPFPISHEAELLLEGETEGAVLFHNGHWALWAEKALDAAIYSNTPLPNGEWSDTRAMAWMTSIYGPGFMEVLTTQKGVYFSPDIVDIYMGNGWSRINDVLCSNDTPAVRKYKHVVQGRLCKKPRCTTQAMVGKDLCYSCDKAEELNRVSAFEKKSEPVKTQTTILGGSRSSNDPLPAALTLAEAETIFKDNGMSKSSVKTFRKLYGQLRRARSDKKKVKLIGKLQEHSRVVREILKKTEVGSHV